MKWVSFILFLGTLATLPVSAARAHPLDTIFHTNTIHLSAQGVRWEVTIYPGPMIASSLWNQPDTDGDGEVSSEEARIWAAREITGVLAATFEGETARNWRVESAAWPESSAAMQTGDAGIGVVLAGDWPVIPSGEHQIAFDNGYLPNFSSHWYNLHAGEGVAIRAPEQTNQRLSVEMVFGAGEGMQTRWESGQPAIPGAPSGRTAAPRSNSLLGGIVGAQELPPILLATAFAIAFAGGALHALTPGHGKALVAAYLVGSRGTVRDATALGGILTLTHTGSVVVVGALVLAASQLLLPAVVMPVLEIVSGGLIVLMGFNQLRWRWRGFRAVTQPVPKPKPPSGGRVVQVGREIALGDHMVPTDDFAGGKVTWRSLLALGVSGGMVPCPDAIAILLVAVTLNRVLLGMTLIAAFSLGLAIVLTVIGIVVVRGRRLLDRFRAFDRLIPAIPMVSAFALIVLGGALVVGAIASGGLLIEGGILNVQEMASPGQNVDFRIGEARIAYIQPDALDIPQVAVYAFASGEAQQLTREANGIWDFAPSPDGGWITYTVSGAGRGSSIWLVNVDGSGRRPLVECVDAFCSAPTWMPDGTLLIYERLSFASLDYGLGLATLWWADPETGETAPLFEDDLLPAIYPRISPSGRYLSYYSPGTNSVHIYDFDGGSRALDIRTDRPPVWHPQDESVLLFKGRLIGDIYGLHLIRYDLATGEVVDLTGHAAASDTWAAWSPDGEQIAFTRQPLETESPGSTQIMLMQADGSGLRALTDVPDMLYGPPEWSPDGRYLLLSWIPLRQGMAQPGLSLLEVETGALLEITTPGSRPVWLHD